MTRPCSIGGLFPFWRWFNFGPLFLVQVTLGVFAFPAMSFGQGLQPSAPVQSSPKIPSSNGDITVEKGRTVDTDVVSVAHSVFVEGHVKYGVAALGGSVTINGQVDGDVAALGGDVWLGPEARVGGDVVVLGGRLYQPPGASVAGKILTTTYFHDEMVRLFHQRQRSLLEETFDRNALLWRAAKILVWFIVAVLFILFVPVQTVFAMDQFERGWARIGGIGLLALILFVGLLALFSMLIKIIIGIPLVIFLMVTLLAMYSFGAVTFYLTLGRLVARWILKRTLPLAAYAVLGLLVLSFVSLIPILNLVTPYLILILSLGISLATKFGSGKPWFVRTM